MFSERRRIGNVGEDIACEFLARRGYRIVARNYQKPYGEIDVIAIVGETVRFVEVKAVTREIIPSSGSRENISYMPEEHAHAEKLHRLARAVESYIEETRERRDYQIDVVAIEMDPGRRTARCRLYEQVL